MPGGPRLYRYLHQTLPRRLPSHAFVFGRHPNDRCAGIRTADRRDRERRFSRTFRAHLQDILRPSPRLVFRPAVAPWFSLHTFAEYLESSRDSAQFQAPGPVPGQQRSPRTAGQTLALHEEHAFSRRSDEFKRSAQDARNFPLNTNSMQNVHAVF